jgi:hypothetical protein
MGEMIIVLQVGQLTQMRLRLTGATQHSVYLKGGARLWRNRCGNYVYVIICVSICCDQIRKNMRKKFKKQTHETHERHETHMVKVYIPLFSLILRKGSKKINRFRKTHERHETLRWTLLTLDRLCVSCSSRPPFHDERSSGIE